MIYPLFIGSHPGDPFLSDCLKSLGEFPCHVIVGQGYEPTKIREILTHTRYNSFLFVPATVVFKSTHWIPRLFLEFPGKSVSLNSTPCPFGSFMGIYRRDVLERIAIPSVVTKVQAVNAERQMSDDYCAIERPFEYFTDLYDGGDVVTIHGQRRMVMSNPWLTKYKGTWNMQMAEDIDAFGCDKTPYRK